jgi:uncharacterized glyoxalase superfamily protein PhnB
MDVRFSNTVLFVSDIYTSKLFYVNILNEKIKHDFGANIVFDSGLSIWQLESDFVISQHLNQENLKRGNNHHFELYYESDNIDQITNSLHTAGITILHEIEIEKWGQKTLRFFDPDKYIIEIGESLNSFILRLSKEGLTELEIIEKTGIQEDIIHGILTHRDI